MYSRANLSELLEKAYFKNTDVSGKVVLLRSCLNVATDDEGRVTEDTRLQESFETIRDLAQNAKGLVITAHLGRPEQKEKKYSFWHVAELLNEKLVAIGKKLSFVTNVEGIQKELAAGNVVLLENVRFFEGEESKIKEARMQFAYSLTSGVDLFVNDAFADYRQSASTYDVATFVPSYIGHVFYREISALSRFRNPVRPFIAVLGGAKLSEKLDSLNAMLSLADIVVVGGAMAYTLLKAQGGFIGNSLVEEEKLPVAVDIVYKAGDKLVLPIDHMIVEEFKEPVVGRYAFTVDSLIPPGKLAVDIGPKTIDLYKNIIGQAKTILTNGPMGVFEWESTSRGTSEVLQAIVGNNSAYKLAGGGDSIAAINAFSISGFDHVSTGGGAMLVFLAYDEFPVLDIILDSVTKPKE
jgi:phosphoglycerate kinase